MICLLTRSLMYCCCVVVSLCFTLDRELTPGLGPEAPVLVALDLDSDSLFEFGFRAIVNSYN